MNNLEFRPYSEVDFTKQRALFTDAFPETIGTPLSLIEHYDWKFKKLPAQPASYQYVAVNDEDLVGYYAALPFSYIIQGQRKLCGMVCDVMTHPKMQGKGIFNKLGHYSTNHLAETGLDFVSGYPIRPHVIAGHLKVGWLVAMKEATYIRPINAKTLLKERLPSFVVGIVNFLLSIYNFLFNIRLNSQIYTTEVLSREKFLEANDYKSFYTEWTKTQKNYLEKTHEFMSWRTSAPETEYQFVVLKKNGRWSGVAITRKIALRQVPTLAILDLMMLNDSLSEVSRLHSQIYKLAIEKETELIASMISKKWASNYKMLTNGFLKTPYVFSIIFKSLKKEMSSLLFTDEKDWNLMWIDSDDF